jgi:hypothetical protein
MSCGCNKNMAGLRDEFPKEEYQDCILRTHAFLNQNAPAGQEWYTIETVSKVIYIYNRFVRDKSLPGYDRKGDPASIEIIEKTVAASGDRITRGYLEIQ